VTIEEYRGFELATVNVTSICSVNISSNDPHLMSKLGKPNVIIQNPNARQAVINAKRHIDELLDGKEMP
jgi:hypothetical protein